MSRNIFLKNSIETLSFFSSEWTLQTPRASNTVKEYSYTILNANVHACYVLSLKRFDYVTLQNAWLVLRTLPIILGALKATLQKLGVFASSGANGGEEL
jgi:hypothetical protein